MPRSSRHKSSKHSSREVRDYSDSEKDPGLKEKKGRDEGGSSSSSRHAKEFASGEKRKLESKSIDIVKESVVVVNVGYTDEYGPSSLKKRKDKVDDDRWTGGDNEHELLKGDMKEMKTSSDSRRSSRRDENIAPGVDGEEGKRSGSKVESKSHRSDRKERSEKEGASERERKVSKSERLVDDVLETDNIGNEGTRKLGSSAEERGRKSATGNTGKILMYQMMFGTLSLSENLIDELGEKEMARVMGTSIRMAFENLMTEGYPLRRMFPSRESLEMMAIRMTGSEISIEKM